MLYVLSAYKSNILFSSFIFSLIMSFKKLNHFATLLFLMSIMTFPRSFIELKLVFLVLFIFSYPLSSRRLTIYPEVIIFYCFVALIGSIWSVIGIFNGGALHGISDSFRLWVFWSFAYMIIITLLRNDDKMKIIHIAITLSGILIFLINIFGLCNYYFNLGLISQDILKELKLNFGIHKGYIQITSHNIGSLFFIIPYLISIHFRQDADRLSSSLTKISLLFTVLLAAISGRRALWLVVVFAPLIIAAFSHITGSTNLLKKNSKRIINILIIAIAFFLFGIAFLFRKDTSDIVFLNHLKSAFSSLDARSIQKGYLFDGFLKYPILGSGFGVSAGYLRSEKAPWLYELTYHQILFNFGIVGTFLIFSLFILYLYFVILLIRRNKNESVIAISILVAFFSFLIGAYSNPYLGSFDFLLYIGMLPYLATYQNGYSYNTTRI